MAGSLSVILSGEKLRRLSGSTKCSSAEVVQVIDPSANFSCWL